MQGSFEENMTTSIQRTNKVGMAESLLRRERRYVVLHYVIDVF